MKITTRVKKVTEYWGGDEFRPGRVRSGTFLHTFVSPEDAQKLRKCIRKSEAIGRISGIGWGGYCQDIATGAEDGIRRAQELQNMIEREFKRCFRQIKIVKEDKEPGEDWVDLDNPNLELYYQTQPFHCFKREIEEFNKRMRKLGENFSINRLERWKKYK